MLSKAQTAQLLPHEAPMIFIDQGVEMGADFAVSVTTLDETHFAAVNGEIPAYIGMEMMAQTVALWGGYRDQLAGVKPTGGFLLGTRRYQTEVDHLPRNRPLYTQVKEDLVGHNGLSSFCCEIRAEDQLICSARINVFKPTDEDE